VGLCRAECWFLEFALETGGVTQCATEGFEEDSQEVFAE
jgi:hypothetical protein